MSNPVKKVAINIVREEVNTMSMYPEANFVEEFAKRTKHNLNIIEQLCENGETAFEVTQLINSRKKYLFFAAGQE